MGNSDVVEEFALLRANLSREVALDPRISNASSARTQSTRSSNVSAHNAKFPSGLLPKASVGLV
jgi:hypothetical protein